MYPDVMQRHAALHVALTSNGIVFASSSSTHMLSPPRSHVVGLTLVDRWPQGVLRRPLRVRISLYEA